MRLHEADRRVPVDWLNRTDQHGREVIRDEGMGQSAQRDWNFTSREIGAEIRQGCGRHGTVHAARAPRFGHGLRSTGLYGKGHTAEDGRSNKATTRQSRLGERRLKWRMQQSSTRLS